MTFGGLQPQGVKRATELGPVTFDFSNSLVGAETISTQSVAASVYSGVDSNPSNIISGVATASGKTVSQKITIAVTGVIYQLFCTITTSAGNTYTQNCYLAIVPPLT